MGTRLLHITLQHKSFVHVLKSHLALKSVVPHPEAEPLVLVAVKGIDAHTTITNAEERCMEITIVAVVVGKGSLGRRGYWARGR